MEIQVKDGQIKRMRPRHNPDVNGYWACDEGRLNYKYVNERRVKKPVIRRGSDALEASHVEAIAEMRMIMGFDPVGKADGRTGEGNIVILMSAGATLEEMHLAKRLSSEYLNAQVFAVRHVPDGEDDKLLRRADKHANSRGAELMGIEVLDMPGEPAGCVEQVKEALGAQGILVFVGFNTHVSSSIEALVSHAEKVIALTACHTSLSEKADLVVPGLTFAEKEGLVVNFDGQVQRLKRAMDADGESEWVIFDTLLASLSGNEPTEFLSAIRKQIGEVETAFGGVDLVNVGPLGLRVSAQPVA